MAQSAPTQPHWEHFAHAADIGVRGIGTTLSEAFEQAALALTAVVTDLSTVVPEQELQLACSAPDEELLLADWLNLLIYEMSTRNMLFCRFGVTIRERELYASVWGERVSPAKHQPAVEPKGATYTALSVKYRDGMWVAQCVVDV